VKFWCCHSKLCLWHSTVSDTVVMLIVNTGQHEDLATPVYPNWGDCASVTSASQIWRFKVDHIHSNLTQIFQTYTNWKPIYTTTISILRFSVNNQVSAGFFSIVQKKFFLTLLHPTSLLVTFISHFLPNSLKESSKFLVCHLIPKILYLDLYPLPVKLTLLSANDLHVSI
jgi:hypothetical protein